MLFLKVIRELATTYQAFERFSFAHIHAMGMTPTQFDVIATLGNQPPMSCKELGEKSLITKGTMTGVLQRLEEKGLIDRMVDPYDGRSMQVSLSASGNALFQKIFPEHLEYLAQAFTDTTEAEVLAIVQQLKRLRFSFNEKTRKG